jgi:hypothetical protein
MLSMFRSNSTKIYVHEFIYKFDELHKLARYLSLDLLTHSFLPPGPRLRATMPSVSEFFFGSSTTRRLPFLRASRQSQQDTLSSTFNTFLLKGKKTAENLLTQAGNRCPDSFDMYIYNG